MANSFSAATEHLADALTGIQDSLSKEVENLAGKIDTLSASSGTSDVSGIDGVKDGDIVKLQYKISQMTKAAEAGASTYTKAEGISKAVVRQFVG